MSAGGPTGPTGGAPRGGTRPTSPPRATIRAAPEPDLEPWPEPRGAPPPAVRPGARRRRRRSGAGPAVPQYLLGMAAGFVLLPLIVGGLWMVVLFYAKWFGDFDTKNDRFSEIVAGSVLGAPFVGLLVGAGCVWWWRRRKARRRPFRRGSLPSPS